VQEYIDQFSELVDQLLAYEHSASDNRYYTARFVDGLKDDIKFVILVQRPYNLDTACCLALLQEEADMARRRDLRKIDYNFRPKPSAPARPLPLPQPPSSANKPTLGAPTSTNVTRSAPDSQSMNKVAALTAYRMARGLCRYCAEKWVKGHKCAATVPLHAVQELWEMLSTDSGSDRGTDEAGTVDQMFMLLSQEAAAPVRSAKTLTFQGTIQGQVIVILVDSGSSNSFLNTSLAPQLLGISAIAKPISVHVANGQVI
jgi:hypothetical protein